MAEHDEHDDEAFQACLALSDVTRRFLLQNRKALTTLDKVGALSSEVGLQQLTEASDRAYTARVARIAAARAGS